MLATNFRQNLKPMEKVDLVQLGCSLIPAQKWNKAMCLDFLKDTVRQMNMFRNVEL